MRKGVNLEVLKKPQRPAFLDELDSAPSNIILSQAKSFFNLTISSLNTELPNNVLKNILNTFPLFHTLPFSYKSSPAHLLPGYEQFHLSSPISAHTKNRYIFRNPQVQISPGL